MKKKNGIINIKITVLATTITTFYVVYVVIIIIFFLCLCFSTLNSNFLGTTAHKQVQKLRARYDSEKEYDNANVRRE